MEKSPVQDSASFGRWVKRCRSAIGLTQEVLAERVGCATQTIRKIEGGQRRPSYQMAQRLAQVFELSPEERTAFMHAARGTEEDRPVVPSLDAPHPVGHVLNLPAYLTPFIGRKEEQANLARLLGTPHSRLITVLGPGGIGKTRLAAEVAGQCTVFPDGGAFVPLASLSDPSALVPAIADALTFTFSGSTDLSAQLLNYLHPKELLLVLDNLEHLLDAEGITLGLLGQILAQAPRVTLLVTSRERLKLQGEWVMEIEGLPVPGEDMLERMLEYPAMMLFLEHAERVQHGFRPVAEDTQAIADICRFVGGMPLGIELAAAWMRVLSPQEIGQEIARSLDMHDVVARDLPERHRSLQAMVDHSWRLLSPVERRTVRRLAVFRGGFSRAAAADVAGASLSVLAALVDKSLLRRTRPSWYEMHELIRQYALNKLQEDQQDYAATHDRHCAYYAVWLNERERLLKGAQQPAAIAELSVDIDNVRAAWEWAVTDQRLRDIQGAAETLHWFYEFRSWFQEGEAVFRRAAVALRQGTPASHRGNDTPAADDAAAHGQVLGQLLAHQGYMASRLSRFDQAHDRLEHSVALLRSGDDHVALARALTYQGIVTYQTGDYERSRHALHEGLTHAKAGGDDWTIAIGLTWSSMVAHALGEYNEAERLFRNALSLWRAMGNPRTTLFCLTFCSITLYALGKYSEAQALLHEALALNRTTDDRWGKAMTLHHLGLITYGQQEYHAALALFREALALFRAAGNGWEITRALNHLGMVLLATGAAAEAHQVYREALAVAMEVRAFPDVVHALVGLAMLRQKEGKHEDALELVLHILHHPASRTETREHAVHLRAEILPQLSSQHIEEIEERVQRRPLEEAMTALLATR